MKEISLSTKLNYIFFAIAIIISFFVLKQCEEKISLKNQLDIQKLNMEALKDSVRVTKNKIGREIFAKKSLMTTNESLELLNKDLFEESKKLQGRVITLQKIVAGFESDTVYITSTVTKHTDGKYSLDWNYDTTFSVGNYRIFSGNSFFSIDTVEQNVIPGITQINQDKFGFSLVTGIREKDGALEIFVDPRYPGMVITGIDGAVIDPHKSQVLKKMFPEKKWSIGPQVSVGIGTGTSITGQPFFGPVITIGVGINYSLFKF
jgi:hypothetical protein